MNENIKISDDIIKMVQDKIGGYPCLIQTPFYREEAFTKIMESSKEIWYNSFVDEKSTIRLEGLLDYGNAGIYVYYNTQQGNGYRFVFMSELSKKYSITLSIKAISKFKIVEVWN